MTIPSVQRSCDATVVRQLGIYLDSDVSTRAFPTSHVTLTVAHCFGILRRLHRSLSHSVFQSLVAALLLTKLDFGNGSLPGIPSFH